MFFLLGFVLILMVLIICIGMFVFSLIGCWKLYDKASVPGAFCLIPFYNTYCLMVRIAKLHWGYFAVYMAITVLSLMISFFSFLIIPFRFGPQVTYIINLLDWFVIGVSILINIAVYYNLAKKFKKDTTWVVLTVFFSFITIPLLGILKKNIYYYNVDVAPEGIYFQK